MRGFNNLESISTDVLVVGGGGAAARAAIEAHDEGASVLMVTKGRLGTSGATAYAVADYAGLAVADGTEDPSDSPELQFKDIIEAGLGMCDLKLSRILVEESLRVVPDLEAWGVEFERTASGKYLITRACFSSVPRNYKLKGHGQKIVKALSRQVRARGIKVIEETMVAKIFVEDGQARGAMAIRRDGGVLMIQAGAVVIATGGAGQLFKFNMNPPEITGDGYALGYLAGAELFNMEFLQYGLGTVEPLTLFPFWLWPFKPRLLNGNREPFMQRYLPEGISLEQVMEVHATHFPFTNRLVSRYLEIGIHKELSAGRGGSQGGILADFTQSMVSGELPDATRKLWPNTKGWFTSRGMDLEKAPVEIACFAHAVNGGLRINADGETTVSGLYAVGEAAGGPHGADRLGGVMLTACQVFGRRAGRAAAKHAKGTALTYGKTKRWYDEFLAELWWNKPGSRRYIELDLLRRDLQELSWKYLLLVRNREGLLQYLTDLTEVQDKLAHTIEGKQGLVATLELWHLLITGRIMAQAALAREETRGSHYREDHPLMKEQAEWVVISKGAGNEPLVRRLPVPEY